MTGIKAMFSWDGIGTGLSLLCVAHCAAMPIVLASIPCAGLQWLVGADVHRWLAGGTLLVGAAAFVPGVCLHRRWTVLLVGSAGLTLLVIGAGCDGSSCCRLADGSQGADIFGATDAPACCPPADRPSDQTGMVETGVLQRLPATGDSFLPAALTPWITPTGGLLMVIAHVLNRTCCRRCRRQRAAQLTIEGGPCS